jgi:hypothetical protein
MLKKSVSFTIALKGLCAVMQVCGQVDIANVHPDERNATWIMNREYIRGHLGL